MAYVHYYTINMRLLLYYYCTVVVVGVSCGVWYIDTSLYVRVYHITRVY